MITKNQIKLIKQLEQKKFRRKEGLFVAEGPKVVGDLMARWTPAAMFAVEGYQPPTDASNRALYDNSQIQRISDDELRRISFLQHPQQVLALFPIPALGLTTLATALGQRTLATKGRQKGAQAPPSTLTLALDGVQDPGNLGTIIRLADWFGIDTIVCSEETADVWNPKVVQATMGSIARVNVVYTNLATYIDALPQDVPVYGTLLDGDNIYEQQLTEGGLIVMGNEGNGLTNEIRRRVTRRLLIPSYRTDTAESLNVAIATAIVCAEFRRRGNACR